MQRLSKAFTLIELIVAITISTLLMSSVMFFITSGIKNITLQKATLENTKDQDVFLQELFSSVNSVKEKKYIKTFSSGALMKVEKNFYNGGFMYIGEKKMSQYYCSSGSTIQDTNHLVFFPFIPFEGEGGDMFSGVTTNVSSIQTSYFSGSVLLGATKLLGDFTTPAGVASFGQDRYVADTLGHQVLKFRITTPAVPGVRVVGLGVAGESMQDGKNGRSISLNNPTGLAVGEGKLFISDTLNNRVLYLDIASSRIYTLLGSEAGLDEPTGLYYDTGEKALYIANSGKGEILKYESLQVASPPNLTLDIRPGNNINGVDNFSIDFFTTLATVTGNPSFTGFNTGADYFTGTTDRLDYYFSDFATFEGSTGLIPIVGCTGKTNYYLEGGAMKKEIRTCTTAATGSIDKYSGTLDTNLVAGNNYQIQLNSIVGSFNTAGAYYVKLSLFDGDTKLREKYFPYFVNGDGLVSTPKDNILSVFVSGLSYPTGVYKSGANIEVNDFFERKRKRYNQTTKAFAGETNLTNFNFKSIDSHAKNILKMPLKSLDVNFIGNLLNVNLEYYKVFSCEGVASESVTKEMLFKKRVE